MGPVEFQTEDARCVLHPALGGWLTAYSGRVPGHGWLDVLHPDPATIARHPKDMWAGNPLLFPLVSYNHLPNADHHYEWLGRRYNLPQHGFARRLPWTVVESSGLGVTIELRDTAETRSVFPFAFSHRLTYRLEGGRLHADHTVTNHSAGTMPFALGIHPYLRVPLTAGGRRDDCRVRIPRATRHIPVGRWESCVTEPFPAQEVSVAGDFSGTVFLGDLAAPELRLIDPVGGVHTVLNWAGAPDLRKVALWSRTPDEPYFCLEPWTALPNAFTRREAGELIELKPGTARSAAWWLDALPAD